MADRSKPLCWLPRPRVGGGERESTVGGARVQVYREGVKKARFSSQHIPTGSPRESLKSKQTWDQKPCALALLVP